MSLLVPADVAAERELIDAEMRSQVYAEHGKRWTQELKRIDPTLEVVRVKDGATDSELKPGHWYILKHIPTGPDAYMELPRPPGEWLYEWLNARDMWNPRVHRSMKETKEKMRAAKVRARKLETEQRQDEMAVAHRAAKRLRGDSGMHMRTDRKRAGEGLR